jgi:hypothetical protein
VGLSNGLRNREKEFLRVLYSHVENCATQMVLGSELYDLAENLGFNRNEVESYSALYRDLGYVLTKHTFDGIAMVQFTHQGIRYVRHLDGLGDLTEKEQQFLMLLYDHAAGDVANLISRNELYPLAERMGFSKHEVYCYSALLHDFGYIFANLAMMEEVHSLKLTPHGVIYVRKYAD